MIFFVLWINIEYVVTLVLIIMFSFGHGLISNFYIFILGFIILIEREKKYSYWRKFYILFLFNFMIKMLLMVFLVIDENNMNIGSDGITMKDIILFVYGRTQKATMLFLFILVEYIMVLLSSDSIQHL